MVKKIFLIIIIFSATHLNVSADINDEKELIAKSHVSFFRSIIQKKYDKAWSLIATPSKEFIINGIVIFSNYELSYHKVKNLIENNINNARTSVFLGMTSNGPGILNSINESDFIIIKIQNNTAYMKFNKAKKIFNQSQDDEIFTSIKEEGVWKVNFFENFKDELEIERKKILKNKKK